MIGLDTNILVRLFADDHPKQREAAVNLLEGLAADGKAVVNLIVVVELVWTLQRAYGFDRRSTEIALERLTHHPKVDLPHRDLVREAVHRSREDGDPIADTLIALWNLSIGCRTTLTFDKEAARMKGFQILPS